jgi:phosphoglycerate dehydrogenase-like enzyme
MATSPSEAADFLPGNLMHRLRALPVEVQMLELGSPGSGDFLKFMQGFRPDILLACWETPQLSPDWAVGKRGLTYVCYLAGSVKKLVPRELMERGLRVSNWGGSISRTVSECTLLLILGALRRAAYWSVAMHREGLWKDRRTTVTQSLFGKTVGLHGFGLIAQELVPLLKPFGCQVNAYSPRVPDEVFERLGVGRCRSLDEVFSGHEVVVELAPYTPSNHHVVTEEILRKIPRGGVFVNVGRGAVVDEEALARVAAEGEIQIGLDVYENEPLPLESPLRGMDNVMLLPHLGGPTKDRRRDAGEYALRNLECYLKGEPMPGEITLEIYERST